MLGCIVIAFFSDLVCRFNSSGWFSHPSRTMYKDTTVLVFWARAKICLNVFNYFIAVDKRSTRARKIGQLSKGAYKQIKYHCHSVWGSFKNKCFTDKKTRINCKRFILAWENSHHFATPPLDPLVSPRNDVWETSLRNSILVTLYYRDLGSASDWSCRVWNWL